MVRRPPSDCRDRRQCGGNRRVLTVIDGGSLGLGAEVQSRGDFSRARSSDHVLATLPIGTVVEASGPGGRFVYPADQPPAVFIAGGIGITPFRSMLTELGASGNSADIVLLYANRTSSIPFREQLDLIATRGAYRDAIYTVTRPTSGWNGPTGRIDADLIADRVADLAHRVAYVSGPRPMVEATVAALEALGVHSERTKLEIFPGYAT